MGPSIVLDPRRGPRVERVQIPLRIARGNHHNPCERACFEPNCGTCPRTGEYRPKYRASGVERSVSSRPGEERIGTHVTLDYTRISSMRRRILAEHVILLPGTAVCNRGELKTRLSGQHRIE